MANDHRCTQCGKVQPGMSWVLGPVCLKCCKKNHARVAGKPITKKRKR